MFDYPDCFKPSKYYIYTFRNMYTNGFGAMHNGSHWIATPKTVEGRMDYWFEYAKYDDGPVVAYLNYALDVGFCFLNFYGDFVHHAFSYIYLIPETIRKEVTIVCAQSPSKSTLNFICNIFEMPNPIFTNKNIVYVHNLLYMVGPHSWQTHYGEIMQKLTEFLREKMKLDRIPITRYAFINRELGKSRRIKNLEEICNEAKKICPSFEYIDLNIYKSKINVETTAKLWASLKFVVHHGGSGFSNCIFVKKGVLKAVIIHCVWYDYPAINFLITCEAKVISLQFDHIEQWSTDPAVIDPSRVLGAVKSLYNSKNRIRYNI
ncbi:hypothetical protein TVAG_273060 [Trichomonas vaginalis G3]|uniref:Glycosyltransferase 61 catalytic domain-containing protein n=1 Tax=Trichomonas vaginalis (strain ATCC PRA-98 / G3) TaxID=412133 RepID=A2G6Y4_TRIV3|nr:glycosyltransferase family [Trichomonas vaginalis G3]EAX87082.1 hypothetical protein TVAG_273060 [Trichomonas vaginalis G3]KAI5495877.1 glycosyltransferase family [Trichomonas vaginalis G3]|eukprot:XP_001300012.1 hypothetical protein [Trichomonas vaginalis G3]